MLVTASSGFNKRTLVVFAVVVLVTLYFNLPTVRAPVWFAKVSIPTPPILQLAPFK